MRLRSVEVCNFKVFKSEFSVELYSVVAIWAGFAFAIFDYALLVDEDVGGEISYAFLWFEVEYMRAVVTRERRQFGLCTKLYK